MDILKKVEFWYVRQLDAVLRRYASESHLYLYLCAPGGTEALLEEYRVEVRDGHPVLVGWGRTSNPWTGSEWGEIEATPLVPAVLATT